MSWNGARALFIAIVALIASVPVSAQTYNYRVPQERMQQLLNQVRYCQPKAAGVVTCWKPITGNYGQTQIRNTNPNAGTGPNAAKTVPRNFPIPATPPPVGVAPEQRALADQLWTRAVALLDRNPSAAMPVLYRCALLGDRRCEATLGIRYQDGDVVKADDYKAAYWFGLAAAQNHRASQYALGGMYLEGDGGLPKDLAKGTELLIKSANQGYDKAQFAVGIAYEFGEGVPRSRAKAIALIRQSGKWDELADILANPRTPKSFANEDAFGAYLRGIRSAQAAAMWAQMRPSSPAGDPYNWYGRMKAAEQRRAVSEANVPH